MILFKRLRKLDQLFSGNITLAEGYLFDTCDLQTLAVFNCCDEIAGFQKAFVGARIKPGYTPAQQFHPQFAEFQIFPVEISYFQLTPGGRFQIFAICATALS